MQQLKEQYIDLIEEQGVELPLFLQPGLYDTVLGDAFWDVVYLTDNKELVASWIVHRKSKGGFNFVSVPNLIKYGGPYFYNKTPNEDTIRKLRRKLGKYHHWIQNISPMHTENAFLFQDFFATERYYTYCLENKGTIDHVYAGVCSDYRNNKIRKAKKSVFVTENIDLQTFFHINKKSFDRQNIEVPYSFRYLSKFDQYLSNHKCRKIFGAQDRNGRIHSVAYLAWDHNTAYFIAAGDDPQLRTSGAGIYLTWHCITYAFDHLGKTTFDFLGSMIPSIERVRKNFGAKKVHYLNIADKPHKLLNILLDYRKKLIK